jgi:hypothetical protein
VRSLSYRALVTVLTLVTAMTLFVPTFASAPPGIALIGTGFIPGTGVDASGLWGTICSASTPANCVPQAIYGGFGSDLTYTGHDDVFIAAPDRGPFDGQTDVPYLDRVNFLHITLDTTKAANNITVRLLDTRLLKNEFGQNFLGSAGAFDLQHPIATLRLDPEGIRVSPSGTFYVSDEYGPSVFEFNRQGHLLRRFDVPAKFLIAQPSSNPLEEFQAPNISGRQANRGMEGLAITPDGAFLVGIMQNALIQDTGLDLTTPALDDRLGRNNRILKINVETGATEEYVYTLDAINRGQGVSEILAINDHQFLVLERDNRSQLKPGDPQDPTRKTIYKIDLDGATDVSGRPTLPETGAQLATLAPPVVAVSKSLFLNLLDADFGLLKTIAEKIEGIAWGPDLPDGRHVLYVISDNDLDPTLATQIYAFAVDGVAANLDFVPQFLPGPLYPPGQVKKTQRQR